MDRRDPGQIIVDAGARYQAAHDHAHAVYVQEQAAAQEKFERIVREARAERDAAFERALEEDEE